MAAPAAAGAVITLAKSRRGRRLLTLGALALLGLALVLVVVVLSVAADDQAGGAPAGPACQEVTTWRTEAVARHPDAAPYVPAIADAAHAHAVDPAVLTALLWQESGFNPRARSSAGALGIAQFMPDTARGFGIDPLDWRQAIPAAARYLSGNLALFQGDVRLALAAYNAGPGAVQRYGDVPPFAETQTYVERITTEAEQLGATDPALCADQGPGIVVEGDLAIVYGIRVHRDVAAPLAAMLMTAAGDGVRLTGSGWRSPQRTAELRLINGCPDVWTARPSSCRVPTAIPGTSMHERGLAVDFDRCSSRGTACYQWLERNASRFGFFPLRSEPWHWSTTGN
jgi:hypothetical protein